MKELGIEWPELDIIQKSLDADYQRRLTEASNRNSQWSSQTDSVYDEQTDDDIYIQRLQTK